MPLSDFMVRCDRSDHAHLSLSEARWCWRVQAARPDTDEARPIKSPFQTLREAGRLPAKALA